MPNFELLRKAAAIIDGIPSQLFVLNELARQDGSFRNCEEAMQAKLCGTIGCAIGWLGMHPDFNALGLQVSPATAIFGDVLYSGEPRGCFTAASLLFNVTYSEACDLFTSHGESVFDDDMFKDSSSNPTSKQLFKNRIRMFLTKYDQPVNPKF